MQKNGLPGRLMRRASETNIGDSLRRGSPALSASQPSSAISPASPSGHLSPSPLSANKSDEEKENSTHHSFIDFNSDNAYKHTTSQSTASLPSSYADTPTTSYPGSALSPTASFNFSPHSNLGSFPSADGQSNGFQRPRSQTFPTLDLEYINQSQNQNSEPMTPKYPVASSTAPSSALEPPSSELGGQNYSLEHAISPQLRRTSSNGSIAGRSTTPLTASAVGSSPSSPTQEDARKAADTLLSFIQSNNLGDHHEIMTILKLTEKLRIHQAQLAKAAAHGMGGLSRIPEGDSEMPNAPPAVEVKIEQTTRA
ncbi:hypothetical protein QBC38DRAFT_477171 [Podospora fimiseda]|uniref:Uncharacterized protein n=1 Tax=Podospora fimiseda TaxID=252190 RepID=A0AAN7BQN3_9PEZI|nr:hypothetical protein QBC38DRAFT_477171 [Podospora fimiseda]